MIERDPWDPDELGLSAREAAELAGVLGYAAKPVRPPESLKAELLRQVAPAPAARLPRIRAAAWAAACAAAAFLVWLAAGTQPPRARLAQVHGSVLVDGKPAFEGQALGPGQVIAAGGGSEAVVVWNGNAAARVSDRGEIVFRGRQALEVELRRGRLLSAVVTGRPYSVVTPHGRVSALGTDFMTRLGPEGTVFCMCRGQVRVSGAFGDARVSSSSHGGWRFSGSGRPGRLSRLSMAGHQDGDIASLRGFLGF